MGKKRSRTGQATLFVILGIVLLAVFSFALYARSLIVTDNLKAEAELILTDAIQSNSINYYVENCLEQVTTEALFLMGEQGGVLNQAGKTLWDDYFVLEHEGRTRLVSYAIKPNTNTRCNQVTEDPPQYPRDRTALEELPAIYATSFCKNDGVSGFFGMSLLPRLCDLFGANAFQETPSYVSLACRPLSYGVTQDTIQYQLQQTTTNYLHQCVNFSVYEEILGQNITVDEDNLNVTIIYGLESVTAVANYPFNVRLGKRGVVTMHEFTYTSPIRFRKVYEYVMDLVMKDNQHHNFNITKDYDQVEGYDATLNLTLLRDPCVDQPSCPAEALFDDILIIKDDLVVVNNQTFTFQVAIKNRRPALDYISSNDPNYDIKATENETITIAPQGYDPDDMPVSYWYEGWREDYSTYLDYDCCSIGPQNYNSMYGPWPGNCTLTNHHLCTRLRYDPDGNLVIPRDWTQSADFQSSRQQATINLSRNDTGIHNVTVYVKDDSGLEDFQILKILIYDLPVAVANGTNRFTMIADRYASIEDPYQLDGTRSRASTFNEQPLSIFLWRGLEDPDRDTVYDERFRISATSDLLTLPTSITYWNLPFYSPDGQDIRLLPLNTTNYFPIDYRLELVVASSNADYSDISAMDLELYQCLPNRGTTPPYPYSNMEDVYYYNHTCCLGETDPNGEPMIGTSWGTVVTAASRTPCYEVTHSGLLRYLVATDNLYGYGDQYIPATHTKPVLTAGSLQSLFTILNNRNYENDVFTREFVRLCDGERGNTCTGDAESTYTQVASCPDFEGTPSTQTERCSGPQGTLTTCAYYQYPRSFEQIYVFPDRNGDQADGTCNPTWRCAGSTYSNTYNANSPDPQGHTESNPLTGYGMYLCQGGCVGGQCTLSVNCACDKTCGATCDSNTPTFMDGPICRYNCLQNNCNYNDQEYCPPSIVCNALNTNFNSGDCNKPRDPGREQYCFFNTACTTIGCIPTPAEGALLRQDYCDQCTATGVNSGQYCPPPGFDGERYAYVYPDGRTCTATTCSPRTMHDLYAFDFSTCPDPNPADSIEVGARWNTGTQSFGCCMEDQSGCIVP